MTDSITLDHLKEKQKDLAERLAEMERHPFPDPVMLKQLRHEKELIDNEIAKAEAD